MESISSRLQQIKAEQPRPDATQRVQTVEPSATGDESRKARTRRLIQLGALTDQYLETGDLEPEAAAELLHQVAQLPEVLALLQHRRKPE